MSQPILSKLSEYQRQIMSIFQGQSKLPLKIQLYWIPFIIFALSFHIYFMEFFSQNELIFDGVYSKSASYVYFRYISYFFLLSACLSLALLKTTRLNKNHVLPLAGIIVSPPLLAFRHLIIQPFELAGSINIALEIAGALAGVYILLFPLPLAVKKILKISLKEEDKAGMLIIASAVCLWGFYLDSFIPMGDAWKAFGAGKHPSAHTFDYWLHIFTQPIHGPQYRPLSYYVIFYFFGKLFGPVAWPFQCLGMILVILSGWLFFYLIRFMTT